MYTAQEISEALRRFAERPEGDTRRALDQMIEAGEVEVAGIVDGDFVWRVRSEAVPVRPHLDKGPG